MKDSGVAWIRKIPDSWCLSKIKYMCEMDPPCDFSEIRDSDVIAYAPMEFIKDGYYVPNYEKYGSLSGTLTRFQNGDIVMAKVTPCFENGNIAIMKQLKSAVGVGSSELFVFRAKHVITQFLFYCLRNPAFIKCACATMTGVGGLKRVSPYFIRNAYCPFPSLSIQQRIVKYLDQKCSFIESLISNHRLIIEKLKEYKQSLITEAVTKGLNPFIRTKDSGVEWIGPVPEHWLINRIGNLYINVSEPGNNELPILSVSINSGVSDKELSEDESDRMFIRSEDRSKYKRVRPGDLTYNMMRAWQGAFGAVRVDGMVSPAYIVARPKAKGIDTRYIEALMRTPSATEEMHRYSHGIADFRLRLYWPEFKNIKICLPDLSEQQQIADYIDMKSAEIDSSISIRESLITKLIEYKKSLIYEVVTGKKEV